MSLYQSEIRKPQIGDVYLMRFGGCGNEQKGWRPGLVFQNNLGNQYSPNIIALPLTSAIKKSNQLAVANLLATSAISFIDPELLLSIWQKAATLNAVA